MPVEAFPSYYRDHPGPGAGASAYWRAMAKRISLSVSVIRPAERCAVTERKTPVKLPE